MTDSKPAAPTNDLGVVDPIRLPAWVPRGIARTPGLARFFIALAAVDIVVRLVGLIGPPLVVDLGPLWLLSSILPRTLWIVLPAIVLIRRPDAEDSIPWVFRGSVVIALTTLAVEPLGSLFVSFSFEPQPISLGVAMLSSVLLTAGWLMLGRGFEAIRPRPATPIGRAVSTLVAVAFVLGAALSALALLRSLNEPIEGIDWLILLSNALTIVTVLSAGYALWVIARGLGDALRPVRATRLGVAAAIVWAVATILGSLVVATFLSMQPLPTDAGTSLLSEVSGLVSWMTAVIAPAVLVAAMAIGLVDADAPAS